MKFKGFTGKESFEIFFDGDDNLSLFDMIVAHNVWFRLGFQVGDSYFHPLAEGSDGTVLINNQQIDSDTVFTVRIDLNTLFVELFYDQSHLMTYKLPNKPSSQVIYPTFLISGGIAAVDLIGADPTDVLSIDNRYE